MNFELYPTTMLRSRSFNALVAPREMLIRALKRHPGLQRFKILYVSGSGSGLLGRLDRMLEGLEVRGAYTVFKLMSILQQTDHKSSS